MRQSLTYNGIELRLWLGFGLDQRTLWLWLMEAITVERDDASKRWRH